MFLASGLQWDRLCLVTQSRHDTDFREGSSVSALTKSLSKGADRRMLVIYIEGLIWQ